MKQKGHCEACRSYRACPRLRGEEVCHGLVEETAGGAGPLEEGLTVDASADLSGRESPPAP